jgi:phosphatidylglycerol:prolipoprotein diacylglycerol transferase
VFCVGYGTARVFVEFFREPDIQIGYLAGGLTMGMLLSLPMIAYGIFLMVTASRRPLAVAGQG